MDESRPPKISQSQYADLAAEDLTQSANTDSYFTLSPFDNDPSYERMFDRIARALHRSSSPHAVLVGEPGVGMLQVVGEFARRAAAGRPPFLTGKRMLVVDGRLVPSEETRAHMSAILAETAQDPELIVVVDGLANLLTGEGVRSNIALFLRELGRARCQYLGIVTPRDFDDLAAADGAFAAAFVRVDVPEPELETAVRLVARSSVRLGRRFDLTIDGEAIRAAVTLTANYVLNDQLPEKAVKVIVQACDDAAYERSQLGQHRIAISVDDIVGVVANSTGIPIDTLRGVADRVDYEHALKEIIIGQDHAVAEVAQELGLIKAGMTDPSKPASVLLFLGQTGTGKTEMAKALARFYSTSKRLRTYTLGNCVEPHSVATIIGVPPGYVGNDRGGRLVNELAADPYGVFLLDEVDKAHPDVLQPFLNLFDEGWVTDQRGVKGYGTRSIFVLTTNVGQRMIGELFKSGQTVAEVATRMKEALSQIRHGKSDRPVFSPEFLARIKRVIVFRPLDGTAMVGIARKLVAEIGADWIARRDKRLTVPADLTGYIGAAAARLDERAGGKEGGRVVRKLITEWLESPLQQAIGTSPDKYRRATELILDGHLPPAPDTGQPYLPPVVVVRFAGESTTGTFFGSTVDTSATIV